MLEDVRVDVIEKVAELTGLVGVEIVRVRIEHLLDDVTLVEILLDEFERFDFDQPAIPVPDRNADGSKDEETGKCDPPSIDASRCWREVSCVQGSPVSGRRERDRVYADVKTHR